MPVTSQNAERGIAIKIIPYKKVLYCSSKDTPSHFFVSGWFECSEVLLPIHFVQWGPTLLKQFTFKYLLKPPWNQIAVK